MSELSKITKAHIYVMLPCLVSWDYFLVSDVKVMCLGVFMS